MKNFFISLLKKRTMGKVKEVERLVEMKKDLENRRKDGNRNYRIIFEGSNVGKNALTFRYKSDVKYDFLQYYKIVMDWAMETTGLKRREIELLLYLYPIGLFDREQFRFICREIGFPHTLFFSLEGEWIVPFPDPAKNNHIKMHRAYFSLSQKANKFIDKMHMICSGKDEIPEIKSLPDLKSSQDIRNGLFVSLANKLSGKESDSF